MAFLFSAICLVLFALGMLSVSWAAAVSWALKEIHPLAVTLFIFGGILLLLVGLSLFSTLRSQKEQRRSLHTGVVIVCMTTLISIFCVELILGSFYPAITEDRVSKFSPGIFRESKVLPFELKKNYSQETFSWEGDRAVHFTTNSLGYRAPEFSLEKPERTYRIILLGDSFAVNLAIDDSDVHTTILERRLNEERLCTSKQVEVINAGYANGYSPDSYAAYLRNYGFALNPDLIIMQYFVRNDFLDLLENESVGVENGLPSKVQSRFRYIDDVGRHRRTSALTYRIPGLKNSHIFWHLHDGLGLELDQVMAWTLPKLFSNYSGDNFAPNSFGIRRYHPFVPQEERPKELQEAFIKSLEYVSASARAAEQKGVAFRLFLLPSGFQAYRESFTERYKGTWGNPYPQREIIPVLERNSVSIWDPLTFFRERAQAGEKLYLGGKNDGHWTEAGTEAAADYLLEQIATSGICASESDTFLETEEKS